MKPTPGPWWYDTYNTIFAGSESTHDLVSICSIPDDPETGECPARHHDQWYPESSANARLIAAAPDLLEMVTRMRQGYRNLMEFDLVSASTKNSLEVYIAEADRLLAKAEGPPTPTTSADESTPEAT